MMRGVSYLLGLLLLLGLLSCAGSPAARVPADGPGGGETSKTEALIEAPVTEPSTAPAPADLGDGEVGNGEEYGAVGGYDEGELRSAAEEPERPDWVVVEKAAPALARSRADTSGLKAGYADDNRQFNYYLQFLREYAAQVQHVPIAVEERILLRARDERGKPLGNAEVRVYGGAGGELARGLTYPDGSFLFFPIEHGEENRYRARVSFGQAAREVWFERDGRREVALDFALSRPAAQSVPLDILFILDTTGSMGEEIQRLRTTIELINLNLSSLSSRPAVRFGLVLYRDRGDEYVTQTVPFTADLDSFQASLNRLEAFGGGDDPEDLQAALEAAMRLSWNRGGVRLAFVITDAAPHLDYGQSYTYADAARDARAKGIKIFGVGTGGLDLAGEYVLRQVAQYTAAKYIFLTYGEEGESEGGRPGQREPPHGGQLPDRQAGGHHHPLRQGGAGLPLRSACRDGGGILPGQPRGAGAEGRDPGKAVRNGDFPAYRLFDFQYPPRHHGFGAAAVARHRGAGPAGGVLHGSPGPELRPGRGQPADLPGTGAA